MIDEAKTPEQIKKASLLTDWLSKYLQMIIEEDAFTRESVPDLKRGNIVSIDMGFNIGEELGGQRPAVVLRNSPKNHKRVLVLPVTSREPKNKSLPIYVYIGKIAGMNPFKEHWANVLNINNVGKQRIIIPPEPKILDGRILDRISMAIANQIAIRSKKILDKPPYTP